MYRCVVYQGGSLVSELRNISQEVCRISQSGAQADMSSSCSQSGSELRPPAESRSMAAGHITQAAVAPLFALENEMINMISTLHLAFRRLASKSKTFVSLPASSAA